MPPCVRQSSKVSAAREEAKRPEQCFDPITAMELGIEENDLWIAAQACEHKLVLHTNDGIARIRDIAIDLLTVENWTTHLKLPRFHSPPLSLVASLSNTIGPDTAELASPASNTELRHYRIIRVIDGQFPIC